MLFWVLSCLPSLQRDWMTERSSECDIIPASHRAHIRLRTFSCSLRCPHPPLRKLYKPFLLLLTQMIICRPQPLYLITRSSSNKISPSLASARRSFSSSQPFNMPSSNTDATNFAGLKPDESKALPERSAEPHEEPIIKSLKELYSCKPQPVNEFSISSARGLRN